jgi:hypothetical protein
VALHQGDIAYFLHGLSAAVPARVDHLYLTRMFIHWLTAQTTTGVSQYDGAIFHRRGFAVVPTARWPGARCGDCR